MPTEGILTLLIIVVSVLAVAMLGVIVFLSITNRRNRGVVKTPEKPGWQKYGTIPPEFQDGQPHFGTTSLLRPYHTTDYSSGKADDGAEKTSLLGVLGPSGEVVMRMRTEEEFRIDKDEFLMGKERVRVDYCITSNPAVSRTHAKMIKRNGKLYIVDLNATNGTYVNGEKIPAGKEIPLEVGDRFRLADEEFQVR